MLLQDPHLSSLALPNPTTPPTAHLLDDIFSTSSTPSPPSSPTRSPLHQDAPRAANQHPSDIPRLRSTHSTAGYREGLSAAKTAALQQGFDEGYALGAVLGLRVGELLGVLDGACKAIRGGPRGRKKNGEGEREEAPGAEEKGDYISRGNREGSVRQGDVGGYDQRVETDTQAETTKAIEALFALRRQALGELRLEEIFAREYWDKDGIWTWDVPGPPKPRPPSSHLPLSATATTEVLSRSAQDEIPGEDWDVTFATIAAAHPVIMKWTSVVEGVMTEWGVRRDVFAGEEWEAGRVGNGGER